MKELEFDIVIFDTKDNKEREKLIELGVHVNEDEDIEESLAKYTFIPVLINDYNQTTVEFKGEKCDAVVCSYYGHGNMFFRTPPMIVDYKEFKSKLYEYYKEDTKAE